MNKHVKNGVADLSKTLTREQYDRIKSISLEISEEVDREILTELRKLHPSATHESVFGKESK